MDISIIGTGRVGSVLGKRLSRMKHRVIYGTRDPNSPRVRGLLQQCFETTRALSIGEAMRASPVILLAVPWRTVRDVLAGFDDMAGRVLVDCTNTFEIDPRKSSAHQIAEWAAGARVVKAFNTTGAANMADPLYGGQKLTMFICGDDLEARQLVAGLAEELGFEALDVGDLSAARLVESLGRLWIHLVYERGMGKHIGFKLLTREQDPG